jgi:hypothetical protein
MKTKVLSVMELRNQSKSCLLNRSWRRVALAAALLAIFAGTEQPVRAVVDLNFQNEYYVSTLAEFHTLFGASTSGYGTAGVYQETTTGATPTVTKLATSGAPGEFVQNTTPNASQGLQLFGWSGSYNNGTALANNVYNSSNPMNGAVLYMQYKTGVTGGLFGNGTTTAMNYFNSIQFRTATSSASLAFTLEGFLGGVLKDTAVLNVTGNTFTTFTENWANVDTVEIVSTLANPVNWGSGTLYLGNVEINGPVVPEAPTVISAMLLVLPLGASILRVVRKKSRSA